MSQDCMHSACRGPRTPAPQCSLPAMLPAPQSLLCCSCCCCPFAGRRSCCRRCSHWRYPGHWRYPAARALLTSSKPLKDSPPAALPSLLLDTVGAPEALLVPPSLLQLGCDACPRSCLISTDAPHTPEQSGPLGLLELLLLTACCCFLSFLDHVQLPTSPVAIFSVAVTTTHQSRMVSK